MEPIGRGYSAALMVPIIRSVAPSHASRSSVACRSVVRGVLLAAVRQAQRVEAQDACAKSSSMASRAAKSSSTEGIWSS